MASLKVQALCTLAHILALTLKLLPTVLGERREKLFILRSNRPSILCLSVYPKAIRSSIMGQENLALLLVTRVGLMYGFLSSLPLHPSQIIAMRAYLIHGDLLGIVSLAGYFAGQSLLLALPYSALGNALLTARFVYSNVFSLLVALGGLAISNRLARESLMAPRLSRESRLYDPRRLGAGVESLRDPRAKLYFVLSLLSYLVVPHTAFSVLPRLTNVWSFRYSNQPLFVAGNLLGLLLGHVAFHGISKSCKYIIEHRANKTYTMLLGRINLALNLLMGVFLGIQLDHLSYLDPNSLQRSIVDLPRQAAIWFEDETSRWFPSRAKAKLSIYGRVVQLEAEKQATEQLLLKAMVEEKIYLQRQKRMLMWGERPEEEISKQGPSASSLEPLVADELRGLRQHDLVYPHKRHDRVAVALLTNRDAGIRSPGNQTDDVFRDTVRQRLDVLPRQGALLAYCEEVLRYATSARRASVGWPEPRLYATTRYPSTEPSLRLAVERPLQEDQREYSMQAQLRKLHLLLFRDLLGCGSWQAHKSKDIQQASDLLRTKPSHLGYLLETSDVESKLSMQAWARLIGRSMLLSPWKQMISSAHKTSHTALLHPLTWHPLVDRDRQVCLPGRFQFLVISKWLESLDPRSLQPFRAPNLRAQERAKEVLAALELHRWDSLGPSDVGVEKIHSHKRSVYGVSTFLKTSLQRQVPTIRLGYGHIFDFETDSRQRLSNLKSGFQNPFLERSFSDVLRQPRIGRVERRAKHRLKSQERSLIEDNTQTANFLQGRSRVKGRKNQKLRGNRLNPFLLFGVNKVYVPHTYILKRTLRRLRLALSDPRSWLSSYAPMLHQPGKDTALRRLDPIPTWLRFDETAFDSSANIKRQLEWTKKSALRYIVIPPKRNTQKEASKSRALNLSLEVQSASKGIEHSLDPYLIEKKKTLKREIQATIKRLQSTQGSASTQPEMHLPVFRRRKRLTGTLAPGPRRSHRSVPKHSIWDVWSKRVDQTLGQATSFSAPVRKALAKKTRKQRELSDDLIKVDQKEFRKSLSFLFKTHPDHKLMRRGIRYLRLAEKMRSALRFLSLDDNLYGREGNTQRLSSVNSEAKKMRSGLSLRENRLSKPIMSVYFGLSEWVVSRVSRYWVWLQDIRSVLFTPLGSRTPKARYTVCFVFLGKPHMIYQPVGQYMSRHVKDWMSAIWLQDSSQIKEWRTDIRDKQQVSWKDISPFLQNEQRSLKLADRMIAIRVESLEDWIRITAKAFLRNPLAALLDAELRFFYLDPQKYQFLFGGDRTSSVSYTANTSQIEQVAPQHAEIKTTPWAGRLLMREQEARQSDDNSHLSLQSHYEQLRQKRDRVTHRLWSGLGFSRPSYLLGSLLKSLGFSAQIPVPLLVKQFSSSIYTKLGYEPQRWFVNLNTSQTLWPYDTEVLFRTTGALPNRPWWLGIDLTDFKERIVKSGGHWSHLSYTNTNPHLAPKELLLQAQQSALSTMKLYGEEEETSQVPQSPIALEAERTRKRVEALFEIVNESADLPKRVQGLQGTQLREKETAWSQRIETASEGLPLYRSALLYALPDLFDQTFAESQEPEHSLLSAEESKQAAKRMRQKRYNRLWKEIAGGHNSFQRLHPARDWKRAIESLSSIQLTLDTEIQLRQAAKKWRTLSNSEIKRTAASHQVDQAKRPMLLSNKPQVARIVRFLRGTRPTQFWQKGLLPKDHSTRLRIYQGVGFDRKFARNSVSYINQHITKWKTHDQFKRSKAPERPSRRYKAYLSDPNQNREQWQQEAEKLSIRSLERVINKHHFKQMVSATNRLVKPTIFQFGELQNSKKTFSQEVKQVGTGRRRLRRQRSSLMQWNALTYAMRFHSLRPGFLTFRQLIAKELKRIDARASTVSKKASNRYSFYDEALEQGQLQPCYVGVGQPVSGIKRSIRRPYAGRKRWALGLAQREWVYGHSSKTKHPVQDLSKDSLLTKQSSNTVLCHIGNRLPRITRLKGLASQHLDQSVLFGSTHLTQVVPGASTADELVARPNHTELLGHQGELFINEKDVYMRRSGLLSPILQTRLDYPFDGLPESFVEKSMYALRPWHYTKSLWRIKDHYPQRAPGLSLNKALKPMLYWIRRARLGALLTRLVSSWRAMLRILFDRFRLTRE
uniref:hypothetical chloroplast RF1 n=1 Tax=Streptosarcina arenaria TaxID=2058782 RepID=UPI00286C03BE|nr:hypothetical chloroplast RF1 [Streptosarcina arenaria]WKT08800.1 hypothetical chloroplast RF1 [Streptosarcina arenaria]